MTTIQTRHYGIVSIAAIEIGKIAAGVCNESDIVNALSTGELFAIGISIVDFVHRHFGKQK